MLELWIDCEDKNKIQLDDFCEACVGSVKEPPGSNERQSSKPCNACEGRGRVLTENGKAILTLLETYTDLKKLQVVAKLLR